MTQPHLREETLSSRMEFDGRLVKLRVDQVRLPDGRRAVREVVEHPGAVAMVPVDGNEVILVQQWRQPIGTVMLEIPAGTLEDGEDPAECADRELREEIGYTAGRLSHLFSLALAPGYSSEIIHIFLAEQLRPARGRADPDETIRVQRLSLAEAVEKCLSGELRDAKTVAGLLAVARMRGL